MLLKEIDKLQLDLLDDDWVQGIYYSEFLEFGEFPPGYEQVLETLDIKYTFKHIIKTLNHWRKSKEESEEEKSWAILCHKVKHEKLLALLAYFIDYGGKNMMSQEHRNNAILASRLYYKLLVIPGYKAYHIYHSQLFAQSLACLGYPKAMCDNDNSHLNAKDLKHEVNSVIKELQYFVKDLRLIIEPLQLSPNDMNFEDILSNLVDITGGAIVNKMANVDKIELAHISKVIYEIIDLLVCQGNSEPSPETILILFKSICPKLIAASMDCKNANNLVRASYVTYSGLLLTKYGKAALPSYTILLEHLCYNSEGLEKCEVRNARVSLVIGLMSLLPRKAYKKIIDWLLQLTTTAKVVHRHIAMEMLSKLLTNDPEEENILEHVVSNTEETVSIEPPSNDLHIEANNKSTVQEETSENQSSNSNNHTNSDIIDTLNTTAEVSNEMEVDSTLEEIQDSQEKTTNATPNGEPNLHVQNINDETFINEFTNDDLNSILVQDINDETIINEIDAMLNEEENMLGAPDLAKEVKKGQELQVTGTSPHISEQESTSPDLPNKRIIEQNTKVTKEHPRKETNKEINTRQDSMPEENEESPEDIAGLLRQRAHTAPYSAIIEAVVARLHDVSGTLRTKALNMLTACLQSDNKHMQTLIAEWLCAAAGSVGAAAARAATDERAAVRRAAVPLLTSLPPDALYTQILVGLCRDGSVLVRGAAVAAVAELLVARRHTDYVDAFLAGPMNQLSDPENKIQAQVTSLVQQMLFDRIQKYSPCGDYDPLPWLFLGGIVRKNMRSHLQRACTGLLKSGKCINHRSVDVLSTHVRVEDPQRSLEALVALTSLAPHVPYHDVGFILQYYYLINNLKERDGRLLPLTLELLQDWSQWIVGSPRTQLRDSLIETIATQNDDGWRVPAVTLAAHLDPCNIHWATELMQISERRAAQSPQLEEWVRAADVALVAAAPLHARSVDRFVAALADPPPEWGAREVARCVAGAGRVCVRSRAAALRVAPALAALLQRAPPAPPAAARNALLALADIATRYSCVAEPLLGSLCACVEAAAAPGLRRAAARAITRLLLAGYLRLRTTLYYKYVALLTDEDPGVRGPAEYYVTSCLSADTIYHHFVDCVLYFNTEECTEKLSFDGRQLVYDVMLQRMSLVQRLNTQCRLAREVLQHAAAVADELAAPHDLPPPLSAALLDTITLLCGARMKLPTKKPPRDADGADIDDLQERVTTNIVSHKMKCTVAEVVVPAVLRLYSTMRARGGQVLAYLVRIATDLLNDYSAEIEELIENDEELVERVRQFQQNIGMPAAAGNARNLVTSSAPPEPDTPRAPRRRRLAAASPRRTKRALRM